MGTSEVIAGTRVRREMDPATATPLAEVFAACSDEDHAFSRTRTVVRLFGSGVRFVSRSEAERLMRGLERFSHVTVDFTGVEHVGQGFVGMAGPVDFMVRRGLPGPASGPGSGRP